MSQQFQDKGASEEDSQGLIDDPAAKLRAELPETDREVVFDLALTKAPKTIASPDNEVVPELRSFQIERADQLARLLPGEAVQIGRGEHGLTVSDPQLKVSAEHCLVRRTPDGSFIVTDGNGAKPSTNGTEALLKLDDGSTGWVKVTEQVVPPGTSLRLGGAENGIQLRLPAREIASFENGISIGRSRDSDLVVPDEQASRSHAYLYNSGDGLYTLTDNNSNNGVILSPHERRIPPLAPQNLTAGSEFAVGKNYTLRIPPMELDRVHLLTMRRGDSLEIGRLGDPDAGAKINGQFLGISRNHVTLEKTGIGEYSICPSNKQATAEAAGVYVRDELGNWNAVEEPAKLSAGDEFRIGESLVMRIPPDTVSIETSPVTLTGLSTSSSSQRERDAVGNSIIRDEEGRIRSVYLKRPLADGTRVQSFNELGQETSSDQSQLLIRSKSGIVVDRKPNPHRPAPIAPRLISQKFESLEWQGADRRELIEYLQQTTEAQELGSIQVRAASASESKALEKALLSLPADSALKQKLKSVIVAPQALMGSIQEAQGEARPIRAYAMTPDGTLVISAEAFKSKGFLSRGNELGEILERAGRYAALGKINQSVSKEQCYTMLQPGQIAYKQGGAQVTPSSDPRAPHGMVLKRPVLGSNMENVDGAIHYGFGDRPLVTVDKNTSPTLQLAYQELRSRIDNREAQLGRPLSEREVLQQVYNEVDETMDYINYQELDKRVMARIESAVGRQVKPGDKIPFEYYLDKGEDLGTKIVHEGRKLSNQKRGYGICSDMAVYAAHLTEQLKNDGILTGKFSIERMQVRGLEGSRDPAHQWLRYEAGDGEIVIVDPAQHFVGGMSDISDRRVDNPTGNWVYWFTSEEIALAQIPIGAAK